MSSMCRFGHFLFGNMRHLVWLAAYTLAVFVFLFFILSGPGVSSVCCPISEAVTCMRVFTQTELSYSHVQLHCTKNNVSS